MCSFLIHSRPIFASKKYVFLSEWMWAPHNFPSHARFISLRSKSSVEFCCDELINREYAASKRSKTRLRFKQFPIFNLVPGTHAFGVDTSASDFADAEVEPLKIPGSSWRRGQRRWKFGLANGIHLQLAVKACHKLSNWYVDVYRYDINWYYIHDLYVYILNLYLFI